MGLFQGRSKIQMKLWLCRSPAGEHSHLNLNPGSGRADAFFTGELQEAEHPAGPPEHLQLRSEKTQRPALTLQPPAACRVPAVQDCVMRPTEGIPLDRSWVLGCTAGPGIRRTSDHQQTLPAPTPTCRPSRFSPVTRVFTYTCSSAFRAHWTARIRAAVHQPEACAQQLSPSGLLTLWQVTLLWGVLCFVGYLLAPWPPPTPSYGSHRCPCCHQVSGLRSLWLSLACALRWVPSSVP